jgi:uncharacterized BrkB/YihY/UPF0761 family membrane protein
MKQPGWKTFLVPFVLYWASNVAFKVYWDKRPWSFDTLTGSVLSAAVFSAITWVFAYRKYAKAELNS